jgi:hypothetical protein
LYLASKASSKKVLFTPINFMKLDDGRYERMCSHISVGRSEVGIASACSVVGSVEAFLVDEVLYAVRN